MTRRKSNPPDDYETKALDAANLARATRCPHYVTNWANGPFVVVSADDFIPNGRRTIYWISFPPRARQGLPARKVQNG